MSYSIRVIALTVALGIMVLACSHAFSFPPNKQPFAPLRDEDAWNTLPYENPPLPQWVTLLAEVLPGSTVSGGATSQPPQEINRSDSGKALVGNSVSSIEEGIRRLQKLGMYGYALQWNEQTGFEFVANFIDRKNPDQLMVRRGTGSDELSALKAVLEKVKGERSP